MLTNIDKFMYIHVAVPTPKVTCTCIVYIIFYI